MTEFPLPAREPSDADRAFETYRFYLVCFQHVMTQQHGDWGSFGGACAEATKKLQGLRDLDLLWIERWLKIAWNTEYLLTVALEMTDPNALRISNQWVPIQAYYAVYAASEAASYALDGQKADGHAKALRKATEFFLRTGLTPWNLAFSGSVGRDNKAHRPVNFPQPLAYPNNLARSGVDPIQMLGTCLRAEHSNRVKEGWASSGQRKFAFDPGHTSLLHFLYRLRVKSNYRDVEIFVNNAPDDAIKDFARAVGFVVFRTLLFEEVLLARRCRKKTVIQLMDDYIAMNSNAKRLAKRREFLTTL
jgi:hypothetical protein